MTKYCYSATLYQGHLLHCNPTNSIIKPKASEAARADTTRKTLERALKSIILYCTRCQERAHHVSSREVTAAGQQDRRRQERDHHVPVVLDVPVNTQKNTRIANK